MEDKKREVIFVDGLTFFNPHNNAPDFVKGQLYLHPDKLNAFMAKHYDKVTPKGYLKANLKLSKMGTYYIDLDTYKKPEDKENHNDNWGTLKSPNANMDNFDVKDETIDEKDIPF